MVWVLGGFGTRIYIDGQRIVLRGVNVCGHVGEERSVECLEGEGGKGVRARRQLKLRIKCALYRGGRGAGGKGSVV